MSTSTYIQEYFPILGQLPLGEMMAAKEVSSRTPDFRKGGWCWAWLKSQPRP